MNTLQAFKELIEHLEERVNRNVVEITQAYDTPQNGEWKFFVEFNDMYTDEDGELEIIYIKDDKK
jgi:hypothetical protein